MKNKFSEALEKSSLVTKQPKATKVESTDGTSELKSSKYLELLKSYDGEPTKGVHIQIPMTLYRQIRDYKDSHAGTTLQSVLLTSIIEWVQKNS